MRHMQCTYERRHLWQMRCRETASLIAAAAILALFTPPGVAQAAEAKEKGSKSEKSVTPAAVNTAAPLEEATDLKSQPLAILSKFPDAGTAMARFVAQAVVREPVIADAVLSIVADSSPQQASAIGAGFVRAVRAMATEHPETARAIARKIMNIENPWLKTTFFALGPTYSANAALTLPANLPPPALRMEYVGDELPATESRLGPTKRQDWIVHQDVEVERKIGGKSEQFGELDMYGTIIAEMASDAHANGAVSTSPTQ